MSVDLERDATLIVELHALAVATTSYTTGQAVAFFDGVDDIESWNRVRRAGRRRQIDHDVLMASAAIPSVSMVCGPTFSTAARAAAMKASAARPSITTAALSPRTVADLKWSQEHEHRFHG